jgi:nucleoside-diphosphate-sugar epimerase
MIAITGANGFIGKELSRYLAANRYFVHLFARSWKEPLLSNKNVTRHVMENFTYQRDFSMLEGVETIIHLAGRAHVLKETAADPLTEFRCINVTATRRLAQEAANRGIKRFIFISSIGVNGNTSSDKAFTEHSAASPHNFYTISKREAEEVLIAIASETGMEVVIIRPPLVYGPGAKGNFTVLVNWICKGIPLPLGAVHNKRSLVALDNLVNFIALCADREKSPQAANEIFLISDGEDVSTTELLCKVAHAYGKKARLIPVPTSWMQFGAKLLGKVDMADRLLGDLVVDSSKARQLLGWQPVVTMDQQLQKMARDAARL